MAAASLRSSQSALGADYRRLCARMDLSPRRHRLRPQAGPADLHEGDQGRGVCRPGRGPLRGALPGEGRQIIVQESRPTRLPTDPHARNSLKWAL